MKSEHRQTHTSCEKKAMKSTNNSTKTNQPLSGAKKSSSRTPRQPAKKSIKEIQDETAQKLVDMMKTSGSNWMKPWSTRPNINSFSKKAYKGINVFLTGDSTSHNSFSSPQWATFMQWKEAGLFPIKGEKATRILRFVVKELDEDSKEICSSDRIVDGRFVKYAGFVTHAIFNASQIQDYDVSKEVDPVDWKTPEDVEEFIKVVNPVLKVDPNRAFYRLKADFIALPQMGSFKDTLNSTAKENYYAALFHELTHWTGAKHRLDRLDDKDRAFEELIAEIGSALLCAQFGISATPREDHAQYLNHWISAIEEDSKVMLKAFSQAQKAVDFLLNLAESNKVKQPIEEPTDAEQLAFAF